MVSFSSNFVLPSILQNPLQLLTNLSVGLILSSVILVKSSAVANAEPAQVTFSIDATLSPTFSDLVNQAESLATIAISQRFQADPTLNEIQITVLGERNGQLVSLMSSRISREAWQANSDIRQWTQYFSASSVLLGYRSSDPVSTRVATRRRPTPPPVEQYPSDILEQARSSGRISEEEYWDLADAID